jgi:CDP-4-dehydro-6-deoxyglucose reductase
MVLATVTFGSSQVRIELHAHETILDGLRRHGYSHRHGCRRGGCGQCKVDIVEGRVEYEASIADTVLSSEDRECGIALSCRAIPRTDHVVVRLRDEDLKCFLPWRQPAKEPPSYTPNPSRP